MASKLHTSSTLLLVVLINSIFTGNAYSKPDKLTTEIYIIGVLHNGNKYIDHNTLYNTLKQLKPDIILWEYHEDFKIVFGLRTARFLKIAKVEIEQLALHKYAKKYRHKEIFGFDTTIVNRKEYIKERTEVIQKWFEILEESKVEPGDSLKFAEYASKVNFYYDYIVNNGLESINKSNITDSARMLYRWDRDRIVPLGKKYVSDSVVLQKFEAELDYWVERNKYMVRRIQEYMDKYPAKRFVILTGLNHKYFLTDGLSADKERLFVLKDIGR